MMNGFLRVLCLLAFAGLLAACGGLGAPPTVSVSTPTAPTLTPPRPAETPVGDPTPGPGEAFTLETLAGLDPLDILLQKDYEPTFSRLESFYPFGRVPAFTLYANGRLIYMDEGENFANQQLLEAQLSPEEAVDLVQQVLDLGFARLESYTEMCQELPDGTQNCLMDAPYTILRGRLPSGKLHEVKIYANFAADPAAFEAITSAMENYTHPQAEPYGPRAATLFLSPLAGKPSGPVLEWPFEARLLRLGSQERPWAIYLEGEELAALLAELPRNQGDFAFEAEGRRFNVLVVPWLPDADFRAAIESEFPIPEPAGSLSACPLPEAEAGPASQLRLAYTDGAQVWLWDEGQEPRSLAQMEGIDRVLLAQGGERLVFTRNPGAGPGEIRVAAAAGGEPRLLAGAAQLTGRVEALSLSEDGQLLAFSHYLDEDNAELWVASLDGSGARRLVSVQDLLAIFDDFPDPDGVIPYSVQWVPGTHRLIYDAFPSADGIFIYVQDALYLVDADSGQKSVLLPPGQGGTIGFSPDGERTAILSLNRLVVMETGRGAPRAIDVPYFAVGFGEYYFYPPVAWAPDSSRLMLALPEAEDYRQDGPVSLWEVPLAGGEPSRLAGFRGFAPSFRFSPGLARLAYWMAPPQSNDRELHLVNLEDLEDVTYVSGFVVDFLSWAPDERHFVYNHGQGEETITMLGDACSDPVRLADFRATPAWLDGGRFLLQRELEGGLELYLANLEGETTLLLSLQNQKQYDVALRRTADGRNGADENRGFAEPRGWGAEIWLADER